MHISKKKPNPFGSSRVDTPFQNHIDFKEVYKNEFNSLKSTLNNIKLDPNHQSIGVSVIGEAGSGKTHLMMRLAKEILKNNRLLFIRQPNNPKSIIYHIYNRILESFVERIPNSEYSQLEYLLAISFSKIVVENLNQKDRLNQKDEGILEKLSSNPLGIYNLLGQDGTEQKRRNWHFIEKKTIEWWSEHFGFSGYSIDIIKGLMKFCSYSDENRRDLVRRWLSANELDEDEISSIGLSNWSEDIDKEEFSLEAISTFGKLSIVDEPLIIVFDQLEALKYNEELLINFGEALKEIFTHTPNSLIITNIFPDRLEYFKSYFDSSIIDRLSQFKVTLQTPSKDELRKILDLKAKDSNLELNSILNKDEIKKILSQKTIRKMLNLASDYFRYKVEGIALPRVYQSPEDELKEEIEKLKREIIYIKKELNIKDIKQKDDYIENSKILHYINYQLQRLQVEFSKPVILSDSDDIGKLKVILEAFAQVRKMQISDFKFTNKNLPQHLKITLENKEVVIGFLKSGGNSFTKKIQNFNELAINNLDTKFIILRDSSEPSVKSLIAKNEIDKLNSSTNGEFITLDIVNRVIFELFYKVIVDIQNRDFDANLPQTLNTLELKFHKHWIVEALREEEN